jgi:hypothetical protein
MKLSAETGELFALDNLRILGRPNAVIEKREDGHHAGCWVHFDNGWTVSIQWGVGNYSDNYCMGLDAKPEDSTTAEVAVWAGDGDMVRWGTDSEYPATVLGYCPMARVQHILDLVAEDKLMQTWQPPTPPPEQRAIDGWKDVD